MHEIAGHENAGHEIAGQKKENAVFCRYFFKPATLCVKHATAGNGNIPKDATKRGNRRHGG